VSAGRIVGIVVGSLVLLTGLGLVLGGGGVLVAERVLADDAGFVSLRSTPIDQDACAVVVPALIDGPSWFSWRNVVTLRLEAAGRGANAEAIFLGLADRVDADRYLTGVSYVEVQDVRFRSGDPTRRPHLEVRSVAGTAAPAAPTAQSFWLESASGTQPLSMEWRVEPGDYCFVLMNADGARGIAAMASVGIKAPIVVTVAGVVLGVGTALVALGLLAVVLSARRPGGEPRTGDLSGGDAATGGSALGASTSATQYPVSLRAEYAETLSPALWLVKWFLLIPHYIVLGFLWTGFACSWAVSLVAILFTGRYPRGLFEYNVGVLRWTWRVGFYGYQALATDKYPPFTLRAGGYPTDLDIPYPEKLSRRLALVKWWLLAIPHYLIIGILVGVGPHWGGLVVVLTVVVGIILLFSSRYPRELFQIILGANRWAFRVLAYVSLMTDSYPPFRLED
jgi:hypothetical protein